MALPNIILPPEMTPVGSVRAELIGSGGTAAMQDEGEPIGVKLLRDLLAISKDMAENLNVLASVAKMQLEEAKRQGFALDEAAAEAARKRALSRPGGSGDVDFEGAGDDAKKGILDNLPFLMFGAGGLAGALAGFFKGLGLTGLLAVAAYMLGDDLNKYITELTGNEDMGSLAEYILYGTVASPAIAGALKGKKFAGIRGLLIGAVVGLTVGLASILNNQVEEVTGSKVMAEISSLLVGALGGAAAGFMVAGPIGAIVGAIIGVAVSTISSIYKYFTDTDFQKQIDEEFAKAGDFISGILDEMGKFLKQLELSIANWFEQNIQDPIAEFLGFNTSEDRKDPRYEAAKTDLEKVKSDMDAINSQAQALYREAYNQPRTDEGRARRDSLLAARDKLIEEYNRMSREDLKAAKQNVFDTLDTIKDERVAGKPRDTSFDFVSPDDMSLPTPPTITPDSATPTPSTTGQEAAVQSQYASMAANHPIVIANQGGDTNVQTINNVSKKSAPLEVSNYDDSIVRSMRNNYALD